MSNALRTFFVILTWRRRWLAVEAFFAVAIAALALRFMRFEQIAERLGPSHTETPLETNAERDALARDIGWAVNAVAKRVPWKSMCLVQALAATMLSRARGLPTTLYLGAAKDPQGKLIAHAWLRCGPRLLTGGEGHRKFTVVGSFARSGPAP